MTKAEVLRRAANLIFTNDVSCSCTAIGRIESRGRTKPGTGGEALYWWMTPGPVGKLWENAHKPDDAPAGSLWFGEFTSESQELRMTLLEEMALCLEEQGFA